jgi:hypothetical protein
MQRGRKGCDEEKGRGREGAGRGREEGDSAETEAGGIFPLFNFLLSIHELRRK